MSCWYCSLSIDERLRRLNRRREYLDRILTYVPETDVTVELANHNAGGLTADMMLTRIDEVDTQDSHEYVNFTRKLEPEAADVEEIESKIGDELIAHDVVQDLVQKGSCQNHQRCGPGASIQAQRRGEARWISWRHLIVL